MFRVSRVRGVSQANVRAAGLRRARITATARGPTHTLSSVMTPSGVGGAPASRLFSSAPASRHFSSAAAAAPLKYVQREEKNGAVWVTMNRPEIHNAFDEVLIAEITQAFVTLPKDHPNARVVVLTGAGASFSAGADMKWMQKMVDYSEAANKQDSFKLFEMFSAIKKCPLPVIARVNGAALGGGSGLVASCDIALAAPKAKFGFTEVSIGLIPAVISGFVMDKISKAACSRYFLTGEIFGAKEASKIGLVSEDFATPEEMDAALEKMVAKIVSVSPAAVKACKPLIARVSQMTIDESKEFVASQIAAIRVSPEGQSGLRSFLSKTSPSWIKK